MSRPLPDRPDLDQLRRQAKELRDAALAGDPSALDRVRRHGPPAPVTLSAAQLAIAREHGFPSWTRLKAGVEYLIKTQRDDGSWFVKSRSRPFQTYFESGFPHGPDQFISAAGSGWAVAALALACPGP